MVRVMPSQGRGIPRGPGPRCLAAWLVAVAAFGLLAGCDRGEEAGTTPAPGADPPAPETMPAESLSPVAIWRKEAQRKDPEQGVVPAESVQLVAELLLQAEPNADKPLPVADSMAMRSSLRGFLVDERVCFTKERATADTAYAEAPWLIEGKCYWAAWLMALATKRPPMTPQRSQEIRKDFTSLAEAIASRTDPAHAALYKRALAEKFERLHPDVLFPALKEPLGAAVREQLVAYVV